jgi:hypothetical protein
MLIADNYIWPKDVDLERQYGSIKIGLVDIGWIDPGM